MKQLLIFAACLSVVVTAVAVIRNRLLNCSVENSPEVDFLKGWSLQDEIELPDEWLNDSNQWCGIESMKN